MIRNLRDRLGDLIISGAMWLAGKLYGTTEGELADIYRHLDEQERQADSQLPLVGTTDATGHFYMPLPKHVTVVRGGDC